MPHRWCRKWELESLIGHLHHATKVVWPGRALLRWFIDLLFCVCNKDHPVRINQMQQVQLALALILEASGFMVQARQSIAYQELFPVVIFVGQEACPFHSDNKAVVAILTTWTSKVPALMHFLHDLLLSAACWGFTFTASHVPGVENKIADAISHFRWQEFRQLAPEAHSSPCPIPQLLLDSF
ncbi:uncharacterized protein [Montipora capricornis]|uniref:uncharacterized protein n=1 Tax=Montipora capricornis TaxID=246305 RepID=UPI0035F1D512